MKHRSTSPNPADVRVLMDVSRLVWRWWNARLPTGIDRVCLAYLAHFRTRADAVIQWRRRQIVLADADSARLFDLLLNGGARSRWHLLAILGPALVRALTARPRYGEVYFNIGHTGLDNPRLGRWIARWGLRAIYLVHDLIPIESPEFCRAGEDARHARRMLNALASASGIVCNSRVTQEELAAFAVRRDSRVPPMTAAWLAGDTLPVVAPSPSAGNPYFVMVSTIEGRKNHILLLRLWKRLVERMGADAPRLMLVGQRGWEADHALAMLDRCAALQGAVIELGACRDEELARLLAGARALLMPSFTEGFGMPVIEALRAGTPVIASDLPVFREIAADIPTYVASFDGVGWERAILDYCGTSSERERQLDVMRSFRAPQWSSHFIRVEDWLQTLP